MVVSKPTFSDLALAAYCPRKLYYRRRDDDYEPPPDVEELRELAFQYDQILAPNGTAILETAPIEVTPTQYRTNLGVAKARFGAWEAIVAPPARDVFLEGRTVRGIAHKVLTDPLSPVLISPGEPPANGVWEPQSVRAVAAAKALAWERETPIERAFFEYPAYGTIREVRMTTRRKAAYRRAFQTTKALTEPPPRLADESKCDPCTYQETCGVRTRTLGSLLFG